MQFQRGEFVLESDYEIRILREEKESGDVDILVDTEDRSINLLLPLLDQDLISRVQLPQVKWILIRFCKRGDVHTATIHFLKNIDLQSHILNFELNYFKHTIFIKDIIYGINFSIEEKI